MSVHELQLELPIHGDDEPDVFPAVRCTRGEKRRVYEMAARLGVKPSQLARRHLFSRRLDPFFSETLRGLAVRVRTARQAGGTAADRQLAELEEHIVRLIVSFNGITTAHGEEPEPNS